MTKPGSMLVEELLLLLLLLQGYTRASLELFTRQRRRDAVASNAGLKRADEREVRDVYAACMYACM